MKQIKGAVHRNVAANGFDGERSIILHSYEHVTNGDALHAVLLVSEGREEPKFYTQEQLDAAVRLALIRVSNYSKEGSDIAKRVAAENDIDL